MKDLFIALTLVFGTVVLLGFLGYLPRLVAWFGAFLPYPHLHNEKHNHLAVIIPARNESMAVEPLFDSLSNQTYQDFEVFVVVKEANDPTIKLAQAHGFNVRVESGQKCKSDALDGILKAILAKNREAFDAYLFLDADTMIKNDYVEEMNNALASGRQIVTSKKIEKNYFMGKGALTLQGAVNGFVWTLIDEMGNRFRSIHNITMFTIGTGLVLRKDIVLTLGGWPYKATLAEDTELMCDAVGNHWTTYYAPYAPIYMEEAPTRDMTNKRRNRWVSGLTAAEFLYWRKSRTLGSFWDVYFCNSLFFSYAIFGALGLAFVTYGIIGGVLFLLGNPYANWYFLAMAIAGGLVLFAFYLMSFVVTIASWKDVKGFVLFRLLVFLVAPFYYLDFYAIVAKALFGRSSNEWDPIARVSVKEDH